MFELPNAASVMWPTLRQGKNLARRIWGFHYSFGLINVGYPRYFDPPHYPKESGFTDTFPIILHVLRKNERTSGFQLFDTPISIASLLKLPSHSAPYLEHFYYQKDEADIYQSYP